MCPSKSRNLYKGKSPYPTIAYEVVCDHSRRVLSVTAGHYGSCNDKTIVKYDGFVTSLLYSERYSNYYFFLRDEAGHLVKHWGLYLICDGGYNPMTYQWKNKNSSTKQPQD